MFCTNCGAEIDEHAKFCGICGASLQQRNRSAAIIPNSEQPGIIQQQRQSRMESLQVMEQVASLIPIIEPDWNQCLRLGNKYDQLNGARVRRGLILPFMIPGGIFSIIFGLFTIDAIVDSIRKHSDLSFVFIFFIFSLALFGTGVFFIFYENKRVRKCREQAAALIPQIDACLERMYRVYSENQLEAYYPFNYFVPECITEIRSNLINFRADSIKEAINIYEQSQFYNQLMAQNAQMMQMMDYIARQTRSINAAASTAAAFSAASFFVQMNA